ncbi:MAG: glycosyltransferase family 2 protein [Euryarchaeota archaeon]
MHQKVAIIILNWNNWKDTTECLESVYQIDYPCFDIIVVDNASQDGSIEKIEEYCNGELIPKSNFFEYGHKNKPVIISKYTKNESETLTLADKRGDKLASNRKLTIVSNDKNYGFAEGCNTGIRFAVRNGSSYVVLLNSDTVVDPQFLLELVGLAEMDPTHGFVGPKVYYYDYDGRDDVINSVGGRLVMRKGATNQIGIGQIDQGQFDIPMELDYVEGSCLLTRAEVIRDIGLLDPAYFTYWEEADWCIRGRKAGYKAVYAPKSRIWHKVAASNVGLKNEYYRTRNAFWFLKKHASRGEYLSFFLYFFLFRIYFFTILLLIDGDFQKLTYFYKGVFDGIRMIRNIPTSAESVE